MARYAVNLPSGKTDQEGFLRLFGKVLSGSGVIASGDLAVAAQATPDMTVSVAAGDAAIFSGSTLYHGWATTSENVTIPANSSGVTKITAVVASIDTAAASATANNPNGMVYQTFTLGGTDTATPTDAQISTGIGGRPFTRLSDVTVGNGVTSINPGNIADTRVVVGVSRVSSTIQAIGTASNVHMVVRAKGNAVTKTSVLRQDNTTNTYNHNTISLSGWGFIQGNGTAIMTKAVSFGVTFAAPPIVLVTALNATLSVPTAISSFTTASEDSVVGARSITATGYTVSFQKISGTFGTGAYFGFSWLVIGELT